MAKKNVKEWLKEHYTLIGNALIFTGGAIIGASAAAIFQRQHRNVVITHEPIKRLLVNANRNVMPGAVFTGVSSMPLKPEQLGELGTVIQALPNYVPGQGFTHFIAIGKDIETK